MPFIFVSFIEYELDICKIAALFASHILGLQDVDF